MAMTVAARLINVPKIMNANPTIHVLRGLVNNTNRPKMLAQLEMGANPTNTKDLNISSSTQKVTIKK